MLKHIAVIMDGNGRWAKMRNRPRVYGHQKGAVALERTIGFCIQSNIKILTVFAFSTENWNRPQTEIDALMYLFEKSLNQYQKTLVKEHIRFSVIGDRTKFSSNLQKKLTICEQQTQNFERLHLIIAANYGGRWDLKQAKAHDEQNFNQYLSLNRICSNPDPELLIRTGGEKRVSNFLLWNLAYSELYFDDVLWPDFEQQHFDQAVKFYYSRTRKFGSIDE